jgi:aldose 1-epimerase
MPSRFRSDVMRRMRMTAIVAVLAFAIALPAAAPRGARLQPGRYAVEQGAETVQLIDANRQTSVSILTARGNIAFEMKVKGHNILKWPNGGNPFLAPWANRLDEQAFYANGKRFAFDMGLGNVRGTIPIHGLLQSATQWKVVEAKADDGSAWLTSRLEFFRDPMLMQQWPFAHTIDVTHVLRDGALEVRAAILNMSSEPMPVSIGFHPYFQLTDSPRNDWTISVAARTRWLLTPEKVPSGEIEPIEKLFSDPKRVPLKGYNLDDVFADLVRDANGRATMTVSGRSQRIEVVFGPNYRAAVIYSPADRDFVCFEPMVAVTNALNLAQKGIYKELQSIAPGGTWQESYWIRPSGF